MTAEKPMLHKNISVSLGMLWRRLSPAEKRIYEIEAEREKIKHRLQFPDYKYRPRRKYKEPGKHLSTPKNFTSSTTSAFTSQKSSFDNDDACYYGYQHYNNQYSTQYHAQNYADSCYGNQTCFADSYDGNQPSYIQHRDLQATKSFEQKTNSNFNTSHTSLSDQLMVASNQTVPSNVDYFGVPLYSGVAYGSNTFGDFINSKQQNYSYLKSVNSVTSFKNQNGIHPKGTNVVATKQPNPKLLSFEHQEIMQTAREQQNDVLPSIDMMIHEKMVPFKN